MAVAGSMVTTAVILAGGLGTRLRGAVPDRPKPMAPVRGRPFLEHLMDYWIDQGVQRFIISTGYLGEMIRTHFGDRYRSAAIGYVHETVPLGTGGGLLLAARGLQDPFLLLNGDTFFAVDLADLSAFHDARKSQWTLALFRVGGNDRYMGLEIDAQGRVGRLKVKPSGGEGVANGGVYVVDPAVLAPWLAESEAKLSLEDDLLPALLASGAPIFGMIQEGEFIDIGVPDDYFQAAEVLPGDEP